MPTARAAAARAAYWASWRRTASPKVYSAMDQGRLRGSRLVDPESRAEARATRRLGVRAQGSGKAGVRAQGSGITVVALASLPTPSIVAGSVTADPSTSHAGRASLRMTSL